MLITINTRLKKFKCEEESAILLLVFKLHWKLTSKFVIMLNKNINY